MWWLAAYVETKLLPKSLEAQGPLWEGQNLEYKETATLANFSEKKVLKYNTQLLLQNKAKIETDFHSLLCDIL